VIVAVEGGLVEHGSNIHLGVNLAFLRAGVGGSQVFVTQMVQALSRLPELRLTLFCFPDAAPCFRDLNADLVLLSQRPYALPRRLLAESLSLAQGVWRAKIDVLWSPANFCAPIPRAIVPQVVTVHDLQHCRFPDFFTRRKRLARQGAMRFTLGHAAALTAVSAFTAGELTRFYSVPPERITVIHEGVEPISPLAPAALAALREVYGLQRPFLFYPAAPWPSKNHPALLAAYAMLLQQGYDLDLVLCGVGQPPLDTWLAPLDARARSRVRHLGFLPRSDFFGVMQAAKLMIFPSLYEGFGLPLLEAMACGTPVVAGRAGSSPEVCGAAAQYVDPCSVDGIAAGVRAVLDNPALGAQLIAAGGAQAASFSWSSSAQSLRDCLLSVQGLACQDA